MLDRDTCREVIELAMREIEGDEGRAFLSTSARTAVEFAGNDVRAGTRVEEKELTVWVSRGRCVGRASNNDLVGRSIKQLAMQASEIALAASPDPRFAPALPPQQYRDIAAYDEQTASLEAADHAGVARRAIAVVCEKGLLAGGHVETVVQDFAVGSSRGNFGFHRATSVLLTITVAGGDGVESGTSMATTRIADLDAELVARRALERALPLRSIEPGRYPVIFEPECVAQLVAPLARSLGARAPEEGPSSAPRADAIRFAETVNLCSDPAHPLVLAPPFDAAGTPRDRTVLVDGGRLVERASGEPGALVLSAIPAPVAAAAAPLTLLVARLHQVRCVDPRSLTLMGATDGAWLVDHGAIVARLADFHWQQSLVQLLGHVRDAAGVTRVWSAAEGACAMPSLSIADLAVDFGKEA